MANSGIETGFEVANQVASSLPIGLASRSSFWPLPILSSVGEDVGTIGQLSTAVVGPVRAVRAVPKDDGQTSEAREGNETRAGEPDAKFDGSH